MYAIKKSAEWILNNHNKPGQRPFSTVAIYTDSLSSILALKGYETKTRIVKETFDALNHAAILVKIHIRWVKAHKNHEGNEAADILANHGADADMRDPVPDLPKMAFSQMKALIHKKAIGIWAREWTENRYTKHKHRQTKNWKPQPDGSAARILVQNNDRLSFSTKVGILTGHGNFNYHEHKINNEIDPTCDLCDGNYIQDAEHIFRECEKIFVERQIIFGNDRPDLRLITDKQLTTFINETDYPWFPPGDEDEDELEQALSEISANESNNSSSSEDNPGYDLFELDSEPDQDPDWDPSQDQSFLSTPDTVDSDSSSSSEDNPGYDLFELDSEPDQDPDWDPSQDQSILSTPDTIDSASSLQPNRGVLNPSSNWLQSDSESSSEFDGNQLTSQVNDLLDTSSSTDESEHSFNEFELNDEYIDDDIAEMSQNVLLNQSELDNLLISPGGHNLSLNADYDSELGNSDYDSELENYLVDPDGNNLPLNDAAAPWNNQWSDEDPEAAPGPHDPG